MCVCAYIHNCIIYVYLNICVRARVYGGRAIMREEGACVRIYVAYAYKLWYPCYRGWHRMREDEVLYTHTHIGGRWWGSREGIVHTCIACYRCHVCVICLLNVLV